MSSFSRVTRFPDAAPSESNTIPMAQRSDFIKESSYGANMQQNRSFQSNRRHQDKTFPHIEVNEATEKNARKAFRPHDHPAEKKTEQSFVKFSSDQQHASSSAPSTSRPSHKTHTDSTTFHGRTDARRTPPLEHNSDAVTEREKIKRQEMDRAGDQLIITLNPEQSNREHIQLMKYLREMQKQEIIIEI